jgi:hypothetical protein
MPYIGGETPTVGDYVKDEYEQFGSVTRIRADISVRTTCANCNPAVGDHRITTEDAFRFNRTKPTARATRNHFRELSC